MIQITEETPVSSVQRLWQVQPPLGVALDAWVGIQFAATNYQPTKLIDVATWNVWRGFALSALAISQPRRDASVRGRLGDLARHIRVNRFDYESVTVGRVFSDSALRCTETYWRNVEFMTTPTLAHLRRNLSALREGLILPPRVFRHPSTPSSPLSNDMSVVRYAEKLGPLRIREAAAKVVTWFDHDEYLFPMPEDAFNVVRFWCVRNDSDNISLSNVRVEHAVSQSAKGIPIVDVLRIPHVRPELIRCGVVDENSFRKLLRADGEVWTIEEVHSERFVEKEKKLMKTLPRDDVFVKPRQGTRADVRRAKKEEAVGLNGKSDLLPQMYEDQFENVSLRCMDTDSWLLVKPIVVEIMRRSHIRGRQSFQVHVRVFAQYVLWAHMAQRDLSLESLLSSREIEQWAKTGLTTMRGDTRATYRSLVRKVAAHVSPSFNAPVALHRIAHRTIRPPYTGRDVERIKYLARGMASTTTRGQFLTCVALGLGAGIDSTDLVDLNISDITDHGATGIEIKTRGMKARTVWMLPAYWGLLREALILLDQEGPLFTAKQRKHKGTVGRLYEQAVQIGVNQIVVEQGRLRSTWLCILMNMPIPTSELMLAAGLSSGRVFGDLSPHAQKAVKQSFQERMLEISM